MYRKSFHLVISVLVTFTVLAACTGQINVQPSPSVAELTPTKQFLLPPATLAGINATLTPSVTFIPPTHTTEPSPEYTLTPALNPEQICGSNHPDGVYLILDCDDIRRIRQEIVSGSEATILAWKDVLYWAEWLHRDLLSPTAINWLWSGGNNYPTRALALAYLVTGDSRYEIDLRKMIRTIVNNTPHRIPYLGPETGWVLSPSQMGLPMQSLLFAYMAIRDTFELPVQKNYDDFFIKQMLLWNENRPNEIIGPWIECGGIIEIVTANVTLVLDEHPLSAQLFKKAYSRVMEILSYGFDKDGGCILYADSYTPGIVESFLLYAESLYKLRGIDLYSLDLGSKTLQDYCQWYLKVMTPEGLLPGINDGVYGSMDPGMLMLCARRYADPSLAFAFERFASGHRFSMGGFFRSYFIPFGTVAWADSSIPVEEPAWTSVLLPNSGLAILRSGWEADDQYMLLQFTNGFHHKHFSYGNIVLYDHGAWMLDNGYHLDSSASMESQYERSISTPEHSTLSLDGANQTFTGGKATFYSALNNSAMVSISSQTYPNFTHRRTVLWAEPWHQWVVVDDASMAISGWHTLQLNWYFSSPRITQTRLGEWVIKRMDDRLIVDIFADYPYDVSNLSRHYDWLKQGDAYGVGINFVPSVWPTRLVTTLTSQLAGMPELGSVNRIDSPNGTELTIERDGLVWTWLLPRSFPGSAQVGDLNLNGQAGYVINAEDGIISYGLFGGTQLEAGGVNLVRAGIPLSLESDLQEKWVIAETTSPATVSLYYPSAISRIEDETGNAIEYLLEENQLTFDLVAGLHTYHFIEP